MGGLQGLFPNRQGAKAERLGLGIFPLGLIEDGQVVEGCSDMGMSVPQRLFPNRQGALMKWFGLRVFSLGPIQFPQVV
jgi:hypothetical protein